MEQIQAAESFLQECYNKLGATILHKEDKDYILWTGQELEPNKLCFVTDINAIKSFEEKVQEDSAVYAEFLDFIHQNYKDYHRCLKEAYSALLSSIYVMAFINELIYVRDTHSAFAQMQIEKQF
jgi:hypothetical protein